MARSEDKDDVHGSGLNLADWCALRDRVVPHYASRGGKFVPPDEIEVPPLPEHLTDHKVAKLVRQYRAAGQSKYFDRAGRALVPGNKLWWLVLTK
jgi:hypothetical protein